MLLVKIEVENTGQALRISKVLRESGFSQIWLSLYDYTMFVKGFRDEVREALAEHSMLCGVVLGPDYEEAP